MSIILPPLDQLINSYLVCCETEGKSPKTIEFYSSTLKRFNRFLSEYDHTTAVADIGTTEARKFIFHLQNNVTRWEDSPRIRDNRPLSPFSIQGYARSIKAFWSWLFSENFMSTNPMTKLKLPKVPKNVVNTFSQEQIRRLFKNLDQNSHRGFRDYTIILLLLDTGIRLSELTSLTIDRVDFGQNCFLVHGKGDRERLVPFGSRVRRALWHYISNFRPQPYTQDIKQMLLTDGGFPMMPRSVQSMVARLGERAGISGVRCSPHTFRHTFAKQYLMLGGDVFSLQRILGHSSLEVVKLYINLTTKDVTEQHRRFSPVDNLNPSGKNNKVSYPDRNKGIRFSKIIENTKLYNKKPWLI